MKTKDFLIVALVPLLILMIPLVAMQFTDEVKWTLFDFVAMWVVLTIPTFLFRLLVTRKFANLPYRLGAGLAVVTGFFMTWVNLAVQIIGHDNAANVLYFAVVLIGLAGVGFSRFRAEGLARTAFAVAAATFLVPVVGYLAWPGDFSPGVLRVFTLNLFFVVMFTFSGLLFRHAAEAPGTPAETKSA
jgi:hypothetical protein